MAAVVHLDTHALVQLYAEGGAGVGQASARCLEHCRSVVISPMVRLEMHYLHEIGRLVPTPFTVIEGLTGPLPLSVGDPSFQQVIAAAEEERWTRDPFDRVIVAQARLANAPLVTRDRRIHQQYEGAVW